jgi:peptidoglycan/LPS O-acetylase OafA/YrhL
VAAGGRVVDNFERFKATRHFKNLEGLRFICISMVIWHHCQPIHGLRIFDRGFMGVDFFFVLSGFLITTLLLRETDKYGSFSLRNFYARRALRILPVYLFVVTCVAAHYILAKEQRQYLDIVPAYYLFLANFLTEHIPTLSITWSLSVEEQYYLLWPLALLLLPTRALVPVCVALIAVNIADATGVFGLEPVALGPLLFRLPNATYAPIIMGSLVALILNSKRGFEIASMILARRGSAPIAAMILVAALEFLPANILGLPELTIHLIMTAFLIALVVREATPLSPFLTHSVITRIGVVSYGIYLYHLLALEVTMRGLAHLQIASNWIILPVYFAIAYVAAEVSFRTLEAYFRKMRPRKMKDYLGSIRSVSGSRGYGNS